MPHLRRCWRALARVPVAKSNPDIVVMQACRDWAAKENTPAPLTVRDKGRILIQDKVRGRVSL